MRHTFQAVQNVICNKDPKEPHRMRCEIYNAHMTHPIEVSQIRKVIGKNVDVRVSSMPHAGGHMRTIISPQHDKNLLAVEVNENRFMTIRGME